MLQEPSVLEELIHLLQDNPMPATLSALVLAHAVRLHPASIDALATVDLISVLRNLFAPSVSLGYENGAEIELGNFVFGSRDFFLKLCM